MMDFATDVRELSFDEIDEVWGGATRREIDDADINKDTSGMFAAQGSSSLSSSFLCYTP